MYKFPKKYVHLHVSHYSACVRTITQKEKVNSVWLQEQQSKTEQQEMKKALLLPVALEVLFVLFFSNETKEVRLSHLHYAMSY